MKENFFFKKIFFFPAKICFGIAIDFCLWAKNHHQSFEKHLNQKRWAIKILNVQNFIINFYFSRIPFILRQNCSIVTALLIYVYKIYNYFCTLNINLRRFDFQNLIYCYPQIVIRMRKTGFNRVMINKWYKNFHITGISD